MHAPPPPPPDVRERNGGLTASWFETTPDGRTTEYKLKQRQYEFFTMMKRAGQKQICTFLSGEVHIKLR
jgi:hypothetical protein